MDDDFANADWDPMREDYYDENVNSYNMGQGSKLPRHQQPANFKKGESQSTKLYVYPLSEGFTKESLDNIFSKFGEVTEIYIDVRSNRWAFVSLKTQAAAEKALRELSNNSELQFKVTYAREKSDSTSVDSSEMKSSAGMNRRKSDETSQTGSQFIADYKRRSIPPERSLQDSSDRLLPSFQFSKDLFPVCEKPINSSNYHESSMNGDIGLQPVPNCFFCKRQTVEMCLKCHQSFCSTDCMIRGYEGHTNTCVQIAPHSSRLVDRDGRAVQPNFPPLSSQPVLPPLLAAPPIMHAKLFDNYSNTISQDFADTSQNYLNHNKQPAPKEILINNSYDNGDITDFSGTKNESDSHNRFDRRSAGVSNSRKSDRRKSFHNESTKTDDNIKVNGGCQKRDDRYNRGPTSKSTTCTEDEDSTICFQNPSKSGKRDSPPKKGRDPKWNHSNKENEASFDINSQKSGCRSGNRSSNDSKKSDDEVSPRKRSPPTSQWDVKPKENVERNDFDSSRHVSNSMVNGDISKNPKFFPPSRVKIEKNSRFMVKFVENGPTAVLIVEEANSFNAMVDCLQNFHFEPLDSIVVRRKCVGKKISESRGTWHRCTISETDPLSVRFIDFDYRPVEIRKENLRKLPAEFETVSPFCYRVNFINTSEEELNKLKHSTFEVIFLKKDNFVWDVELVEKPFDEKLKEARDVRDSRKQSYSSKSGNNKMTKPSPDPSEWKVSLKKGVPIKVLVSHIDETSKKIYVTDWDKAEKLQKMIVEANPLSLPELKDIRVNTMCLSFFIDVWCRARIVSVDSLRVFYIDYGNTEPALKRDLRMLPGEFFNIDPIVVPIRFMDGSKSEVNSDELVNIIPLEENIADKVWIVRLSPKPEKLDTSTPMKELSRTESSDVAIGEILSVKVVYKVSFSEYFVGRTERSEIVQTVSNLDEEVIRNKPVKTPILGLICAHFFDGYCSRVKIVQINPLIVYYLDFGNEEKTEETELYDLPEDLKAIPPLAFKINFAEPTPLEEFKIYKIQKKSEKIWTVNENSDKYGVNSRMEVLILADLEDSYGVLPLERDNTFRSIQQTLSDLRDELPRLKTPEIGLVCAEQAHVLSRVRIVAIDPLILYYIDFGCEELKESYCDLRVLPEELALLDPVAFKITLKNDRIRLKEMDKVFVKILEKVLDNHYFVEILTEMDHLNKITPHLGPSMNVLSSSHVDEVAVTKNEAACVVLEEMADECIERCSEAGSVATVIDEAFLTSYPSIPKKYFIEDVRCNTTLTMTIINCLTDSRYTGMLLQKGSRHQSLLKEYFRDLSCDSNYRPRVGEFIAALLPGTEIWCRALVLCESTNVNGKYRVAMIDVGLVDEVDEIAPLPHRYHSLSNLSAYCEILKFSSSEKPLKLYDTYKCDVKEKLEDGAARGFMWKSKPNDKYTVILKPWRPPIDEMDIRKMPVRSGSRVKITAYNTSNTCCISLCDNESFDVELSIMEDIASYCIDAEPMDEEPFKSEIVGVNHENTFLRGKILEKQGDSFSILLLDRGIECMSTVDQLRSLPEYLKLPFGIAVPVTLKNIPTTEIYKKVANYMKTLINQEKKFDLIIDEATKEVELKFLANESYNKENDKLLTLNEYLAALFIPDWKKKFSRSSALVFDDAFSNEKFFLADDKFDKLEVGSKMNLFVTGIVPCGLVVVNRNGKPYKKQLDENLSGRLAEYADAIRESYVPGSQELCIVKHEDIWYRAICLSSAPNEKINLQLIDDGRMVLSWHQNIRRMIQEFYNYVPTAVICTINDELFDENKAEKLLNTEIRVKILERCADGEYLIDSCKIFQ